MKREALILLCWVVLAFAAPIQHHQLPSPPKNDSSEPKPSNMIIIRGGEVFTPAPIGKMDVLLSGGEIIGVVSPLSDQQVEQLLSLSVLTNVYNVSGQRVIPGFVDSHVHLTGGGGELGPESRTPEAKLSELTTVGITTAIGVLGTDSVSRSLENLLAKTKAMNNDGITAHMFTGAYRVPLPLFTSTPMEDLMLVQEVLGVGELAISDHRSSVPSFDELVRIASDCRIGGMLSKKAGVVHVHVGKGTPGLQPLWEVLEKTEVPITQFHPTHLASRTQELLDDAKKWARAGGFIDFTAEDDEDEENACLEALAQCKSEGVPLGQVTLSSDAYGSFPFYGDNGQIISYGVGKPDTLLYMLKLLVSRHGWSMEEALGLITKNVATVYQLGKKGQIQAGFDGDVLVLDEDFAVTHAFARGKEMVIPGWAKKGMFE